MCFEIPFAKVSIAKEAFFWYKFCCQDLTGGIIYKYQ